MDIQSIAGLVFLLAMISFVVVNRKRIVLQKIIFPFLYVVMYRSQWGIAWMDSLASRFPRTLRALGVVGVAIGFLGMGLITYELVSSSWMLLTTPDAPPTIKPVLPFEAKGVFFVPFLYWITAIFVIAGVHEFAHGVMARVYGLPVKSSGFAFLGILIPVVPAAFVEPDEKKLVKRGVGDQLAIFAAGPFSNLIFAGFVFLIIFLVVNPVYARMIDFTGVKVATVNAESPASRAGFEPGELITRIGEVPVTSVENFTAVLRKSHPGETLEVVTNISTRIIVLGMTEKNASKPFFGIAASQGTRHKPEFVAAYGQTLTEFLRWTFGLFYWLLLLNLGIGLFNLLPLGPIDGGRMLHLVLSRYVPAPIGTQIFSFVSFALLGLILANVAIGFVR
ncbi:site-2 protease family protein [Candidatus Woesearchaeota archaeon]|nr:site-2 protease family protein [Candidatus Woesearchaeota archaeon]